jgi:large subunit ribosomal protein L23Ae
MKSTKVAAQIKSGAGTKSVKVRTKVHFYKPKTLKLDRKPVYPKKSVPSVPKMDKYRIIKYPLTTEVCNVCVLHVPKRPL